MASAFSHAVVALALGAAVKPKSAPGRFWALGIACAVLPDLDSIGFAFGIRYGDLLGHRGLSHSLAFAALAGAFLAWFGSRDPRWRADRLRYFLNFFLATASHGFLDALTNGGLGVAFFSPFDTSRYFLPWQPVQVSPINIRRFFDGAALAVMKSELIWIWLPSAAFALGVALTKKALARTEAKATPG